MPETEATESANLKTLKASCKGSITRIKNLVTSKGSTLSLPELECRMGILESYFKQLLAHQTRYELLSSDTDHANVRGDYEELYISSKSLLLDYIAKKRQDLQLPPSDLNQSVIIKSGPKNLQKVKIPKFSGKYSEYPNFIGIFNKSIGDNENYDVIEKCNILVSSLDGLAKNSVREFQISEENYPKILTHLKQRFDNKTLMFQELISELFDLPKISKSSATSLRNLVDNVNAIFSSMLSIGSPDDIANSMIIHVVMGKLDADSQAKWEDSVDFSKLLKWDDCSKVLSKRCQFLECKESKASTSNYPNKNVEKLKSKSFAVARSNNNATTAGSGTNSNRNGSSCALCKNTAHAIYRCPQFLSFPVLERYNEAKKLSLCLVCLAKGHSIKNCKSTSKCRVCASPHNTLLHRYNNNSSSSSSSSSETNAPSNANAFPISTSSNQENLHSYVSSFQVADKAKNQNEKVILATAVLQIKDSSGRFKPIRALLDSGSQLSFITENMVNSLGLHKSKIDCNIHGIGNSNTKVRFSASSTIKSRINEFKTNLKFFILPNITGILPDSKIVVNHWNIPENIELADPLFFKQNKIDLLLGAETFFTFLSVGQIQLGIDLPVLQKTLLGWIVSGKYKDSKAVQYNTLTVNHIETTENSELVDELLQKFWKLEHFEENVSKFTEEQEFCEKSFYSNVFRNNSGRIVVKLPFKRNSCELGNSRIVAEKRFLSLERKLQSNDHLKLQYSDFLAEYLDLGHMEQIEKNQENLIKYYLPHHCVFKHDSSTTKIRVVFDGSCKTTTNLSLNDILMVGPTVQDDLFSILLRFRFHKYALKADICKMYRQILVDDQDSYHQCILWRNNKNEELRAYRLKTVTYGTSSASYLATKALVYLAEENSKQFPIGSEVISKSFYVDDLLCGGGSISEIFVIRNQVDKILRSAGMELKKWYSNCPAFLEKIPENDREKVISLDGNDIIKALGMSWQPCSDEFKFILNTDLFPKSKISKRSVLSDLAKLFDPLGLINPVVVKGKIIMQQLWLLKLDWDESLPSSIHTDWQNFKNELQLLNKISLPRFILKSEKLSKIELHGFADASLRAYGGCIYIRCIDENGNYTTNLLTAKSRVAPTSTQSIPRLELCASLLLSTLVKKVIETLNINFDTITLWTDSEIVLDWLAAHASTWNIFVANRVAKIQEITKDFCWRHVNSKSNAADLLSRGATVSELINSRWFCGPEFLYKDQNSWPPTKLRHPKNGIPEQRPSSKFTLLVSNIEDNYLYEIINKFSNYSQLINVFAYVIRFTKNSKLKNMNLRCCGSISPDERDYALLKIVELLQKRQFHPEISLLQKNVPVSSKSSIKSLNPFVDKEDGVLLLKVGGRLKHADIPYSAKHPILLSKNEPFTKLLIRHMHFTNLHAGPQALLATIRQRFWIINGRAAITKIVNNCIRCFHFKPKLIGQIMGDLPKYRVQPKRPFYSTGVDFCGPVLISPGLRGKKLYKAYICVFVCFTTHAVHLELVSSLSSETFIACLKRFIGRRGVCRRLFCDNGTNFVGARKILQDLYNKFQEAQFQKSIINWCSTQNIEFCHIPPRSPHFGGLWEAAVKSAKKHLNRCVQDTHLTFEELSTVLIQIEAILNSRPMSQLSSDPNDEEPLTPGHFLIGAPLNALPENEYSPNTSLTSLQRFHRISLIQQHFWKRWSVEYLQTLQKRYKWQTLSPDITIGKLVLIGEDNLPPQQWALGRIVTLHPGKDGKVRVVDIKCKGKILRRQIHSLAPLPLEY